MQRLLLSLFLAMTFTAVFTTPAAAQWGEILSLEAPAYPLTERSQISFKVNGMKGHPCLILEHSYRIVGNKIVIDATLTEGDPQLGCIMVLMPFEFTKVIGSLTPGDYIAAVTINGVEQSISASFTVSPHTQTLTLTPATGTYLSSQAFDFGLIIEDPAEVVSGEASLFRHNEGSAEWVDISVPLMQCLQSGVLEPQGKTYRCPALSEHLEEGTYTIHVTLKLYGKPAVSEAVTWTVLGVAE